MTSGLVYHNFGQLENWISLYPVTQCHLNSQNAAFYMICFSFCLQLTVKTLQLEDGRMIQAAKFGQAEEAAEAIELTDEEKVMEGKLRV